MVLIAAGHVAALLGSDTSQIGDEVKLFVIALVIVSPFAIVRARRILADRRARRAALAPTPTDDEHEPDPDDLAAVIGAIEAGDGTFAVVVPAAPTIDHRPAPAVLVDQLIDDALRRSGVEVVGDATVEGERHLQLRRGPRRESPGT